MLKAILSLSGFGLLFGIILSIAYEKLKVEVDERVEEIGEILPQANCGACGYPGCSGYAQAVVDGVADLTLCSPGGPEVMKKIAEILGQSVEIPDVKIVTRALCGRDLNNHKMKYEYDGIKDCSSAVLLGGGGPLTCTYGCIGLESCMAVCQFDAISFNEKHLPVVDPEKCTKCMACVKECPKDLFVLTPSTKKVHVLCSSKDKGAEVRKYCDVGCIACKLCEKNCAYDAIHVVDNIAIIDYEKCVECGVCVHKCPKNTIVFDGGHEEVRAEIANMELARKHLKAEMCKAKAIIVEEGKDPEINEKKCNGCLVCFNETPEGTIRMKKYVKPVPVKKVEKG